MRVGGFVRQRGRKRRLVGPSSTRGRRRRRGARSSRRRRRFGPRSVPPARADRADLRNGSVAPAVQERGGGSGRVEGLRRRPVPRCFYATPSGAKLVAVATTGVRRG